MCRWLTYSGPSIYLEKLLFEPENSLINQSLHARKGRSTTNGDGFGVGWYGERDVPGTYHEILPAWNDRNLRNLSHQLRSTLFFAHVRASTGTATSRANCHPFTHGKWLFMHNGQIGGYDKIRRRLDLLIPDELYPYRIGTTDSELMFFLLFRHGLERDPVAALDGAVGEILEVMSEAKITEPLRITAALSNGERIWAIRFSSDAEPPSLYWSAQEDNVIILSEPLGDESRGWNSVPPGHVLIGKAGAKVSAHKMKLHHSVASEA
jgi:glutamine amidotransferase